MAQEDQEDALNYVVITDEAGTRRVDMSQIDLIINTVCRAVGGDPMKMGRASFAASEVLRNSDLSREQLVWLADQLIHKVAYYGKLWTISMTRDFHENLGKQLALRDAALHANPPVQLWPELDGIYETNPADGSEVG